MAEFILKDQYGKEHTFDHDKIFVQGTDGELVQFTEGTGDTPAVVQPLEVTENGTYTAPDGVDGYSPVTVNVDPTKITIFKEKEMDGFVLNAQLGYVKEENPPVFTPVIGEKYSVYWDGEVYDNLSVEDAGSLFSGAVYIGNGSKYGLPGNNEPFAILYISGVIAYCAFDDSSESHRIGVWKKVVQEISLQDKTITENGTYTADSGYDGLGSVMVEVKGGGGGLPAGGYWKQFPSMFSLYSCVVWVRNGKPYFLSRDSASDTKFDIRVFENGVYTKLFTDKLSDADGTQIEYNGNLHKMNDYGYHTVFDAEWNSTSKTRHNEAVADKLLFIMDGKLYKKDKTSFYKWIEDSDTWEMVEVANSPTTNYDSLLVHGRNLYIICGGILYKVDWDAKSCTTVATGLPTSNSRGTVIIDNYIYFKSGSKLYKYDIDGNGYELVSELPHSSTNLYKCNNRLCVYGYNSSAPYIHMEYYEVTE